MLMVKYDPEGSSSRARPNMGARETGRGQSCSRTNATKRRGVATGTWKEVSRENCLVRRSTTPSPKIITTSGAAPYDQEHSVDERGKDAAIGQRKHRRRIQDYKAVLRGGGADQSSHTLGRKKLGGIRRHRAGNQEIEATRAGRVNNG